MDCAKYSALSVALIAASFVLTPTSSFASDQYDAMVARQASRFAVGPAVRDNNKAKIASAKQQRSKRQAQQQLAAPKVKPTMAGLDRLIKSGHYQAAYELANKLSEKYAGDAGFDFLLGTAALRSGHYKQAVFAYDRVLIAHPGNDRVRLDKGLAFFKMGDHDNARTTFKQVLDNNPPENVKRNVSFMIAHINNSGQYLAGKRFKPYLKFGVTLGNTTNANSATDDTTASAPVFSISSIVLDSETGRANSSPFNKYMLEGGFTVPLTSRVDLMAALGWDANQYWHANIFNTQTITASVAPIIKLSPKDRLIIPLMRQNMKLASQSFRNTTGGSLRYDHFFSKDVLAGAYLEYNNIQYNPANAPQSTDLYMWGGRYGQYFPTIHMLGSARGFMGREISKDPAARFNSRSIVGAELGARFNAWNKRLEPYANATWMHSVYDETHFINNEKRLGVLYDFAVGTDYNISKSWKLNAHYQFTNNLDRNTFFRYDRNLVQVGIVYKLS